MDHLAHNNPCLQKEFILTTDMWGAFQNKLSSVRV